MMKGMRRLISMLVAAALLAAMAPAALAGPPAESGAVLRGTAATDYLYWEGHLLVLVGQGTFADGCAGIFEDADARTVSAGNGAEITTFSSSGLGMLVFEIDADDLDDVFAWLGANCAAAAGGNPPTPIAEGDDGLLKVTSRVDTDGVIHNHNGVNGKVTTAEGDVVHLSTFAQLTIGPNGSVDQLRVNYGG